MDEDEDARKVRQSLKMASDEIRNEQIEREDKEKIEADLNERKRKVMSYQGVLHFSLKLEL